MTFAIRPAVAADLGACYEVWLSTDDDHSYPRPPAGTVLPLHRHELGTGCLLVAELDGAVAGFGATLGRSGVTYLADLFVRPEQHSLGIGRALLEGLFGDDEVGAAVASCFTFASSSSAARRLYRSFGMADAWELAYLRGSSDVVDLERLPARGIVATPAMIDEVAALDAAVTGRDRRVDLVHVRDRLGGTLLILRRGDGESVGYAVVIHPQWWAPWLANGTRVGPVGVLDEADAVAAVGAAVRYAVEIAGASIMTSTVPVPHPAYAPMLAAGFTETDRDLYMTTTPALLNPTKYLPTIDTP